MRGRLNPLPDLVSTFTPDERAQIPVCRQAVPDNDLKNAKDRASANALGCGIDDWISPASGDKDERRHATQRESMKVVRSIKIFAGLILVTFSLALSGCSNAPSTIVGFASDAEVIGASQRVDPEKVLLAFEPFDGIPVNVGG